MLSNIIDTYLKQWRVRSIQVGRRKMLQSILLFPPSEARVEQMIAKAIDGLAAKLQKLEKFTSTLQKRTMPASLSTYPMLVYSVSFVRRMVI